MGRISDVDVLLCRLSSNSFQAFCFGEARPPAQGRWMAPLTETCCHTGSTEQPMHGQGRQKASHSGLPPTLKAPLRGGTCT
jgi:hypothetical protein